MTASDTARELLRDNPLITRRDFSTKLADAYPSIHLGDINLLWDMYVDYDALAEPELRPLTANDVNRTLFDPRRFREGYDVDEVDDFMDEIEANIAQWQRFYSTVSLLAVEILEHPSKFTTADVGRHLEQLLKMAPVRQDG